MDIEKIINNIKTSQSFEGLEASQEVIDLIKQHFRGEVSIEEIIKKIKIKHGLKR